jgi:hypothetical protein
LPQPESSRMESDRTTTKRARNMAGIVYLPNLGTLYGVQSLSALAQLARRQP